MIEQIEEAFKQSSATLQSLKIVPTGSKHILFAIMTYTPGHWFESVHLRPLIGLADCVIAEAKIIDEGKLKVSVIIDLKNYPTSSGGG